MRSIGYYGDSPFLLCNYGSSEYAQAFSRIGSLHSCIYIVNEDLKIKDVTFTEEKEGENVGLKFKDLSISFNEKPIKAKKGLIVGPKYERWVK